MCLGPLKSLDNKYTTFGKMIKGDEVLKALGSAKTAKGDYPVSLPAPSEPPARHCTGRSSWSLCGAGHRLVFLCARALIQWCAGWLAGSTPALLFWARPMTVRPPCPCSRVQIERQGIEKVVISPAE